jgi:transaldolase
MTKITRPQIFLDSGNPEDTKKAKSLLGFLDGQTTNPSLVAKNPEVEKFLKKGKKLSEKELLDLYRQIIQQIGGIIPGPISAEVYADWDTPVERLVEQAEMMSAWGKNIYIKFPVIPLALTAAEQFVKKGGKVNMTLVFDLFQSAAVYRATQGAHHSPFISPFVGRWDDRGYSGLDLIKNIVRQYKGYYRKANLKESPVKVLSASIRSLDHLYGSIFYGANILTIPLGIIQEWIGDGMWIPDTTYRVPTHEKKSLIYHDVALPEPGSYDIQNISGSLLSEGLAKFLADWNKLIQ